MVFGRVVNGVPHVTGSSGWPTVTLSHAATYWPETQFISTWGDAPLKSVLSYTVEGFGINVSDLGDRQFYWTLRSPNGALSAWGYSESQREAEKAAESELAVRANGYYAS